MNVLLLNLAGLALLVVAFVIWLTTRCTHERIYLIEPVADYQGLFGCCDKPGCQWREVMPIDSLANTPRFAIVERDEGATQA